MALRIPGGSHDRDARTQSALEAAIVAEKAASLGFAGRALEKALAKLGANAGEDRQALIDAAADRTWSFFVQRELCGLRDNRDAIEEFAIPPEVMARVGARRA